jgi:hypothetical protein
MSGSAVPIGTFGLDIDQVISGNQSDTNHINSDSDSEHRFVLRL